MTIEKRVIKKYPNRRLYDTTESKYITLDDVKKLVLEGVPFLVTDKQTGEDITRNILLQIILVDAVFSLDAILTAVGLVEYQHSPKQYVGDGTVFRARPEARYYLLKDADWRPFIGGGVSFVKVWTSQYSKHGLNPMITGGINYRNIFIARGAYLFRDRTPLPGETRGNDISGFRVGFDFWQPVSEKWLVYFGHEITNYGFTQLPGYPNEGRHRATAFAFRIGVARRIGE